VRTCGCPARLPARKHGLGRIFKPKTDPDLDPIRDYPWFGAMLAAAEERARL